MQGKAPLRIFLALFTAAFLVFLYAPMAVLSILSFQTGPEGGPQFPIIEWSTYWYRHLLGHTPPSRVAPLDLGDGQSLMVRASIGEAMSPIDGVSADTLAASLKSHGHRDARRIASWDDLPAFVRAEAKPGDIVVCLGAGDITAYANALPAKLVAAA